MDGCVEQPEDYLYSSARNYADMSNLLEVDVLFFNIYIVQISFCKAGALLLKRRSERRYVEQGLEMTK